MRGLLCALLLAAAPAGAKMNGALDLSPLREAAAEAPSVPGAPAETCFRLDMTVYQSTAPGAGWQVRRQYGEHLSKSMLPSIAMILVPWSYKVRGENLSFSDLALEGDALKAVATLDKNEFPMDESWDLIWEREVTFTLGEPQVFESAILERRFKVVATLAIAPDAKLCRVPDIFPR